MMRFTEEHEWVRLAGDTVTVGITDFAQQELGDITFVEQPEIGKTVRKGESFCVVESVKAASDIYAPVGGTVATVNTRLNDTPEMINDAAESDGWICTLSGVDVAALEDLMTAAQYAKFCNK